VCGGGGQTAGIHSCISAPEDCRSAACRRSSCMQAPPCFIRFLPDTHPPAGARTCSVELLQRGFVSGSIITVDDEDAQALGKPWTRRYIYNQRQCGRCKGPVKVRGRAPGRRVLVQPGRPCCTAWRSRARVGVLPRRADLAPLPCSALRRCGTWPTAQSTAARPASPWRRGGCPSRAPQPCRQPSSMRWGVWGGGHSAAPCPCQVATARLHHVLSHCAATGPPPATDGFDVVP